MSGTSFFGDMLQTITDRGRQLLSLASSGGAAPRRPTLSSLCERLLGGHGEASGMAIASIILDRWSSLGETERQDFMVMLLERFGPDEKRLDAAIEAHCAAPSAETVRALHAASEPRRQEILRRLNLAPDGVGQLVVMRENLLKMLNQRPELSTVDADFTHLFGSWFNRGFLELNPIDWTTSANVLEKIIRYEAVHEIQDWHELRRRVEPPDRRCFAFCHPQLAEEPLIFVEVALTSSITATVGELLDESREAIAAEDATTAVFYSISNCQAGLRGVSFGNFLIKQVAADLRQDLPTLSMFVTLSPVPKGLRVRVTEDASGPERIVEWFMVESWAEHLRQHKRVSHSDADLQRATRRHHAGPEEPVVRQAPARPPPQIGVGARLTNLCSFAPRPSPQACSE